jgi:hypothetical protein
MMLLVTLAWSSVVSMKRWFLVHKTMLRSDCGTCGWRLVRLCSRLNES